MTVSFIDVVLSKERLQNAIWEKKSRMEDKNVFLLNFKFKVAVLSSEVPCRCL